jgi:hypothetical protein
MVNKISSQSKIDWLTYTEHEDFPSVIVDNLLPVRLKMYRHSSLSGEWEVSRSHLGYPYSWRAYPWLLRARALQRGVRA